MKVDAMLDVFSHAARNIEYRQKILDAISASSAEDGSPEIASLLRWRESILASGLPASASDFAVYDSHDCSHKC